MSIDASRVEVVAMLLSFGASALLALALVLALYSRLRRRQQLPVQSFFDVIGR